jgi:hypothetical protein
MNTYKYPTRLKATLAGLALVATALGTLSVSALLSDRDATEKLGAAFILLIVMGPYWNVLRSFSIVTVDNEVLRVKRPFLRSRSINIGHISKIRYRTTFQCLELSNQSGDNIVRIDYSLKGYAGLLDLILNRRPELWCSMGQSVFRVERHMLAFIAGIGLIGLSLGAYFVYTNQLDGAAFFLILSVFYFISFGLTVVHTAVVNPDGIVLHYYLRQLTVPFSACKEVTLKCEYVRSKLHHVVTIDREGRKPLELSGFEDGGIRLFHAVSSAFKKQQSDAA